MSQKLERLKEEDQVEKPFQRKQMKIRFPERGRSGRSVITIKNLEFEYEDKVRVEISSDVHLLHQAIEAFLTEKLVQCSRFYLKEQTLQSKEEKKLQLLVQMDVERVPC